MKRIGLIFIMIVLIVMIGALHRAGLSLVEEKPINGASLLVVASQTSAVQSDPVAK